MEQPPKNILIDFTKWIVKWLLIIILGLSILGGLGWLIYEFVNAKIPMIAIKCTVKEFDPEKYPIKKYSKDYFSASEIDKIISTNNWYLVMKKRFEDKPEGLYQSPHHHSDFSLKTSETDFIKLKRFNSVSGDDYNFGGHLRKQDTYFVSRKTLMVSHKSLSWDKCEEVSVEKFYERASQKTKDKKSKLKF